VVATIVCLSFDGGAFSNSSMPFFSIVLARKPNFSEVLARVSLLSSCKLANLSGFGTGVRGFLALLLPVPPSRLWRVVGSDTAGLRFGKTLAKDLRDACPPLEGSSKLVSCASLNNHLAANLLLNICFILAALFG